MLATLSLNDLEPLNPAYERKSLCCFEVTQLLIHYMQPFLCGPVEYETCHIPSLNELAQEFSCAPLELLRCFEQFRQAGFNYKVTSPDEPITVWADAL